MQLNRYGNMKPLNYELTSVKNMNKDISEIVWYKVHDLIAFELEEVIDNKFRWLIRNVLKERNNNASYNKK